MEDLRVALIQADIEWENIPANLEMLGQKITAIKEEADLIVLPEMFSSGFCMEPERLAESMSGSAMLWMKTMAATKNCVVTGSLMLYDEYNGEKRYYNRIVWMRPDGSYETYDKRHLFSLSLEPRRYSAGDKKLIVDLNGWKVCPMICYDLRFPAWSRNAINDNRECEYDVLLYVANWPERRATAWNTLLQARAIENQAYVIGVNRIGSEPGDIYYSGDSSVIDPLGTIVYRRTHEPDVTTVRLSYEEMAKARRMFPFLKDADEFELK